MKGFNKKGGKKINKKEGKKRGCQESLPGQNEIQLKFFCYLSTTFSLPNLYLLL